MTIAIVDMDMGNIGSVVSAFNRIGAKVKVTDNPDEIRNAESLILPGVGAFGKGMGQLRSKGLIEVIREYALDTKRPVLGICLGMQLLADSSDEHGVSEGLGLIPGRVVRLQSTQPKYRVPNIGWATVRISKDATLFEPSDKMPSYYHVHSYHFVCAQHSDIAATIEFSGQSIVTAVERDNIYGVQFHPEKSQDDGLDLLAAFARLI